MKLCEIAESHKRKFERHGMTHHRLYSIYNNMKNRCLNKNFHKFESYGKRGIKICDEWLQEFKSFYTWAFSCGYKEGLTLDRIDVDGNYCPENCRWVDIHIQASNKRPYNNSKTGYKGIYPKGSKFAAQINVNKERFYLGSFKTIKEAVNARNIFITNNKLKEYKIQEI